MKCLPFDSHNHIHMGPSEPSQALLGSSGMTLATSGILTPTVGGMAIMSTHPRDFVQVADLAQALPKLQPELCIVPCFGIHPWWLHELTEGDWQSAGCDNATRPAWVDQLESTLSSNPNSIVGETGLDGFHFDAATNELVSPMEKQVEAFRWQMELAAQLGRPVSIHVVQAFGPLFETLSSLKKSAIGLPPAIYFHAFGGKEGTVDQIAALCGRRPASRLYFGFAPVVNFRSPKTANVIRKVGIDRLVLETDHEDAALVYESLVDGIRLIAKALDMEEDEVVQRTTSNALDLYGR